MRQNGIRTVRTQSYSLPEDMIKWIDDFGSQSKRTKSQVVQLAIDLLRNRMCGKEQAI